MKKATFSYTKSEILCPPEQKPQACGHTLPSRFWEPGYEEEHDPLPKEEWLPDDMEPPFE